MLLHRVHPAAVVPQRLISVTQASRNSVSGPRARIASSPPLERTGVSERAHSLRLAVFPNCQPVHQSHSVPTVPRSYLGRLEPDPLARTAAHRCCRGRTPSSRRRGDASPAPHALAPRGSPREALALRRPCVGPASALPPALGWEFRILPPRRGGFLARRHAEKG